MSHRGPRSTGSGVSTRGAVVLASMIALASAPSRADEAAKPRPAVAAAAAVADGSVARAAWTEKVWKVVNEAPKGCADDVHARRLGALGAPAIPAVFAIYEGLDGGPGPAIGRTALLATFRALPPSDVVAFLRTTVDGAKSADTLVKVMQVSGEVAGRGCTQTALAAASRLAPIEQRSPVFGAVVRAALASALAGDPDGWSALKAAWPTLDPALLAVARSAVEDTKSTDGLRFLGDRLGDDPKADAELMASMCRMPRLRGNPLPRAAASRIRFSTIDRRPDVRAASVLLLGRLRDPETFEAALPLLADPDAAVVAAALATLRRATGADVPADADAWRQWRADELTWKAQGLAEEVSQLRSGEPEVVVAALKSLGARPMHAADFLGEIAARLSSDHASVRAAACASLGSLDDPGAVGPLVGALSDADPDVAKAALSALRSVTGLDLPADPAAWRAVVR